MAAHLPILFNCRSFVAETFQVIPFCSQPVLRTVLTMGELAVKPLANELRHQRSCYALWRIQTGKMKDGELL